MGEIKSKDTSPTGSVKRETLTNMLKSFDNKKGYQTEFDINKVKDRIASTLIDEIFHLMVERGKIPIHFDDKTDDIERLRLISKFVMF